MKGSDFQLRGTEDPRLAQHATSPLAVWLWSADGAQILWANPVGARVFGAADSAALSTKTFGPADSHRRQIARLTRMLPPNGAIRLQRLRGFGAPLGLLVTCRCMLLEFPDSTRAVLVTAFVAPGPAQTAHAPRYPEPALPELPPVEPAPHKADQPVVPPDEMHASRATQTMHSLPPCEVQDERKLARGLGRGVATHDERCWAHDVDSEDAVEAIRDTISLGVLSTPLPDPPPQGGRECTVPAARLCESSSVPPVESPDHERPVTSGEAPAEFALIDEVAEPLDATASAPLPADMIAVEAETTHEPSPCVETIADVPADQSPPVAALEAAAAEPATAVEQSGHPLDDSARNFARYDGSSDGDELDRNSQPATSQGLELSGNPVDEPRNAALTGPDETAVEVAGTDSEVMLPASNWEELVEPPPNVVPFRPLSEQKSPTQTLMPTLTPVENNAFNELARQLSERLDREPDDAAVVESTPVVEPAPEEPVLAAETSAPIASEPSHEEPAGTAQPEPPAQSVGLPDRELLDLLPTGILIYQLDRLVYANPAFLSHMGYPSLHALEEAGGLDALVVEPGVSTGTSEAGTPVTIAAGHTNDAHAVSAADARLHPISWDNEPALALICSPSQPAAVAPTAEPVPTASEAPAAEEQAAENDGAGHFHADDLAAILDTTAEGVLMFDAEGKILACNRSAEALFGYDGDELTGQNLATLFAPESQRAVQDYLAGIKGQDIASLLDSGCDVLGLESKGGTIPLSMTMGRTRSDGSNFFAVFRDLSQSRSSESEVKQQRLTEPERAANAKADMLARISDEVRTPLDAIIGFTEVMIGERFGSLGDERYAEYVKDIRASGQRVISIVDDLLELSRIETGKLNLVFADQNLNDLIESCVTVMQPQANRGRTIIRTSLAHALPTVTADANTLRQIVMNLIGTSIHLANAGGQVIVSTALTDRREVALRIRDTGHGLSDQEVAAALEPFRMLSPSDHASDRASLSLSLTKALVEANRAQFNIKSAPHSGTLTEVVFQPTLAQA